MPSPAVPGLPPGVPPGGPSGRPPGPPPGDDVALVLVDLTRWRTADLALVDLLARVCLQARRLGARVVVVPGRTGLAGLLELTGLAAIVPLARSELRGQAEPLEQASVEEVVDVCDAPVPQLEDLQGPRLQRPSGAARLVLGEGGRAVELDREQP
jgi:hypothetical protein